MTILRFAQVIALAALTASWQQTFAQQAPPQPESGTPASCPVTSRTAKAFMPPAPYPTEISENSFWLGTEKLWTSLVEPTIWHWAPRQPGHEREAQPLTAKMFWGRAGYDWRSEPYPKLSITGRRLDGPAPPLVLLEFNGGHATNAILGEKIGAMVTGFYVPTPGCWEITGDYLGDKLSFVVWVTPAKEANGKTND